MSNNWPVSVKLGKAYPYTPAGHKGDVFIGFGWGYEDFSALCSCGWKGKNHHGDAPAWRAAEADLVYHFHIVNLKRGDRSAKSTIA